MLVENRKRPQLISIFVLIMDFLCRTNDTGFRRAQIGGSRMYPVYLKHSGMQYKVGGGLLPVFFLICAIMYKARVVINLNRVLFTKRYDCMRLHNSPFACR